MIVLDSTGIETSLDEVGRQPTITWAGHVGQTGGYKVIENILDLPLDTQPDADEFVRAAMEWHFSPETGSAYWLERAKTLLFDPRTDVKGFEDLALFPNIINELPGVRGEDLIPRGYGPNP